MDSFGKRIGAIINKLKGYVLSGSKEVLSVRVKSCGYKIGNQTPRLDETEEVKTPYVWGGYDSHNWFCFILDMGEANINKVISLTPYPLDNCGECMNAQYLAYIDGETACGLDMFHTSLEFNYTHPTVICLYAYTGMSRKLMDFTARAAVVEEQVRQLYYDLAVPYDILSYLEDNSKNYVDIYKHLNNAINLLELTAPYSTEFYSGIALAQNYLAKEFYGNYCTRQDHTTVCVGHTHIDLAWLWTLTQTREKVQRTFSTILMLMRKYPDFKFMSSQPQLYEFFKEEAPKKLYDEMKIRIKEGRWEVEGAMWLEADCNLISGESMVRQILFGKRFIKSEFDIDSRVLWLPDVFGYSASMPQILLKSGVDRFVTSKISWNDTNMMPHDAFMWRGIDGSEVFTYFLTAQDKVKGKGISNNTTYIGIPEPRQIEGTWERFQDKALSDEVINTFGYGDGGGGPTAEHIEKIHRMQGGIQGCANATIGTASGFLNKLYENAKNNPALKKWVGELYLEFHRGTYTSQANNKKSNRKAEFLLKNTELTCVINQIFNKVKYPQEQINGDWKTLLLNQFHDIIPGSSIAEVYEDSDKDYKRLFASQNSILSQAQNQIAAGLGSQDLMVFNYNPFIVSDTVKVDNSYLFVKDIPANGYKTVKTHKSINSVIVENLRLENKFFAVTFNACYEIDGIYDKRADRQVVKSGEAVMLNVYDDNGNYEFDAWELKAFVGEKKWRVNNIVSAQNIFEGARSGFSVVRKFKESVICQNIFLYDDIDRIDFENQVDWKNHNVILKAELPTNINAVKATYDIQFGNIERSTHCNTSWDEAKFEVCGHKFADLSESGFGVSLLNDCKYGYDVHDSILKLTLLRSPTDPAPNADIGCHLFKYSIFPHTGAFGVKTVKAAYAFNNPLTAVFLIKNEENGREQIDCTECLDCANNLPEEFSFASSSEDSFVIETIKLAEEGNAYILRGYECLNKRVKTIVKFGIDVKRVALCDLMENEICEIPVSNNTVKIQVKPYEIVTLKIEI